MDVSSVADVVVARIDGEIDISNAQELGDALIASVTNDAVGVVLDLSELAYLDSAGVHLLVRLLRQLRTRRQQLRAVAPAEAPIRRVLGLTAVDTMLPVDETAEAALLAMQPAAAG